MRIGRVEAEPGGVMRARSAADTGLRHDEMPMTQTDFPHAKPIFEYFEGWTQDISGCREFSDLPPAAQDYVEALEAISGTRMSVIGVGPDREQSIVRHELIDP